MKAIIECTREREDNRQEGEECEDEIEKHLELHALSTMRLYPCTPMFARSGNNPTEGQGMKNCGRYSPAACFPCILRLEIVLLDLENLEISIGVVVRASLKMFGEARKAWRENRAGNKIPFTFGMLKSK